MGIKIINTIRLLFIYKEPFGLHSSLVSTWFFFVLRHLIPLPLNTPHHVFVLHAPLRPSWGACWRSLQPLVLREQDVHGGQQHLRQVVAYLRVAENRNEAEAAGRRRKLGGSDGALTSSLKFLKAETLSSTLSWLSGRSFKCSIT